MQMWKNFILAAVLLASGAAIAVQAQAHDKTQPKGSSIPSIVQQDGRYALMVDGAPYLMLGMQTNNSSDWPATLPQVWPAAEALHVNTVETPIYWEQFEPKQGQFDTTQIDTVLAQARAHHLHLVLLWFGTWKNGSQHYMPEWMKLDPEKYSHVINKRGEPVDSPSPLAQASLDADIQAFTAFMKHLKAADPEHTVLMVQVENETGTWGTLRDYSAEAERLFAAPVPADVLKAMNISPGSRSANWQDVFGVEAEVNFHAWAIAHYVGQIAAAGKAVYPLPLYVNAALRDPIRPGAPGSYESGGPTDNVLNIWKAEAPAIDILAPDIYNNDATAYLKILDLYHRPDNALFVPETSSSASTARFFFAALGRQAIGYSPFGLDYTRTPAPPADVAGAQDSFLQPTAQNYILIGPMMRDIARLNFEGKLQAVSEEQGKSTQTLHFGVWDAVVTYGSGRGAAPRQGNDPTGRALVAQLAENQFLVTGINAHVDFRPAGTEQQRRSQQIENGTGQTPSALIDGKWIHRQFLRVEDGTYENGSFKFRRILNGDQTDFGLNFSSAPLVLRVSVATY